MNPDLDIYIFDAVKVKQNGWNLIHELGHNIIRPYWTPDGAEEVTVNIFTLHAFHLVCKQKPTLDRILNKKLNEIQLKEYSSGGFLFEEWGKNPYIGLLLYVQLINSFGWNAFKIVFREYESLSEKEKMFVSDVVKWDEFIVRFSNVVGLDVSPLFYFWNIPFSDKPSKSLNDLTPWLPNDDVAKLLPDRIEEVKKNYNGLLFGNESLYSSCPKIMYPDDFEFDSIEKLDSLKPNKISYF